MDGTASLLSLSSSTVLQRFSDHKKYVVCAAWHPEGQHFATGSYDHSVCLYERSASSHTFQLKKQFLFASNVESIHFTLDGKLLLVAAREDNYLHCVNVDTLTEWKLNMNANQDDHVSFSALHVTSDAASKYLLVATDKDRSIMFSLADSRQVRNFWGSSNDVFSQPRVAFDPTAKYVYCTAQDQKLHVYDVGTEKVLHKNGGHSAPIRDMQHHPRENCIATASFDRTVKLWTHVAQAD
jgi:WD40 repeat protein